MVTAHVLWLGVNAESFKNFIWRVVVSENVGFLKMIVSISECDSCFIVCLEHNFFLHNLNAIF